MEGRVTGPEDWRQALRSLGLPPQAPVIAHASLSAFGTVGGGAEMIVEALLSAFPALIMPAFTYATMVTPEVGPPDNGVAYGAHQYSNSNARFFDAKMAVDRLIGAVAETLRRRPDAARSMHPILSFTGARAEAMLAAQTLADPLAPVAALHAAGGWVLLLGVDHTVNTSIHWAERQAGRKAFIRWALTADGVVECPSFPGCSDGFNDLAPQLAPVTRRAVVGSGLIQAVPLDALAHAVRERLSADPLALLCSRTFCERCIAFRERNPRFAALRNH
jgi:aminoglycoside 3-N-acetyltransferase